MSWPASIRDTNILEDCLKSNKEIPLDDACRHNSQVFYTLMQYADKMLPQMALLKDEQMHRIADSVAYLIRTDHIFHEYNLIGPQSAPITTHKKMYTEDGFQVHLKNDPSKLSKEFRLDDEYASIGAELFRCYSGSLAWSGIGKILDQRGSLKPAFNLADTTAFLVVPTDLFDYKYTQQEIMKFNALLNKTAREI